LAWQLASANAQQKSQQEGDAYDLQESMLARRIHRSGSEKHLKKVGAPAPIVSIQQPDAAS